MTLPLMNSLNLDFKYQSDTRFCYCVINSVSAPEFLGRYRNFMVQNFPLQLYDVTELYLSYDQSERSKFMAQPEFTPPSYLPYGNVGTTRKLIMEHISLCKIPSSVLKSINFNYQPCSNYVDFDYRKIGEKLKNDISPHSTDCEDWERHIQLHNDVDSQARTTERTYENEKEVVWEKGSSGLVFYTDALYWEEKAGKNVFDEDTVDDWDVDMAIYTDPPAADRDAQELLGMREVEAAKWGKPMNYNHLKKSKYRKKSKHNEIPYGGFEQHTNRFGSKQLIKSGWIVGQPLAKGGLVEPIQCEIRSPKNKSGLGYYAKKQPSKREIIPDDEYCIFYHSLIKISTIYDEKNEVDDTPLQSAEPTFMKYRPSAIPNKKDP